MGARVIVVKNDLEKLQIISILGHRNVGTSKLEAKN